MAKTISPLWTPGFVVHYSLPSMVFFFATRGFKVMYGCYCSKAQKKETRELNVVQSQFINRTANMTIHESASWSIQELFCWYVIAPCLGPASFVAALQQDLGSALSVASAQLMAFPSISRLTKKERKKESFLLHVRIACEYTCTEYNVHRKNYTYLHLLVK